MDSNKLEIIKTANYDVQLQEFEGGLISFLEQHDLPSVGIFVGVPERLNVFNSIDSIINKINPNEKQQSLYLSKFIAAVASGLFDAALNYLWDETILQIRKRVAQND